MTSGDAKKNGPQVWRAVLEGGVVQEVNVSFSQAARAYVATSHETTAFGDLSRAYNATPRRTVMSYATQFHWHVLEIVAPGEKTAEEKVTAEFDRCLAEATVYLNDATRRNDLAAARDGDHDGETRTDGMMSAARHILSAIRAGAR